MLYSAPSVVCTVNKQYKPSHVHHATNINYYKYICRQHNTGYRWTRPAQSRANLLTLDRADSAASWRLLQGDVPFSSLITSRHDSTTLMIDCRVIAV